MNMTSQNIKIAIGGRPDSIYISPHKQNTSVKSILQPDFDLGSAGPDPGGRTRSASAVFRTDRSSPRQSRVWVLDDRAFDHRDHCREFYQYPSGNAEAARPETKRGACQKKTVRTVCSVDV